MRLLELHDAESTFLESPMVARQHIEDAARIGLRIDICDAVQHAHLQGVIHRDLKPGNILVIKPERTEEYRALLSTGDE